MTAQAQLAVLGRYRVMRLVVKSQEVVHPGAMPDDPRRRRGHRATTRVGQPPKPRYFRHSHVWHPVCAAAPLRRRQTRARHDAGARLSPFARAAAATLTVTPRSEYCPRTGRVGGRLRRAAPPARSLRLHTDARGVIPPAAGTARSLQDRTSPASPGRRRVEAQGR